MANISKRNRRREKEIQAASRNRREIIAARLSRRDLMKMGLLTSAGFLIPKNGLSARAPQFGGGGFGGNCFGFYGRGRHARKPADHAVRRTDAHPANRPVGPSLNPAPTVAPNTAAGERRTRNHQALTTLPPAEVL